MANPAGLSDATIALQLKYEGREAAKQAEGDVKRIQGLTNYAAKEQRQYARELANEQRLIQREVKETERFYAQMRGSVAAATTAAIASLSTIVIQSNKAYGEAQAGLARLDIAIRNFGGGLNINREVIQKFADEMSDAWHQTDEAIIGAAASLARLKPANDEVHKSMIQVTADYAAFKKVGIEEASERLVRGAQNSGMAIRILEEAGVKVGIGLERQLQQMDKFGNKAGIQNILFTHLSQTLRGTAVDMAKAEGALWNLTNAFGEVNEMMGGHTKPAFDSIALSLAKLRRDFENIEETGVVKNFVLGLGLVATTAFAGGAAGFAVGGPMGAAVGGTIGALSALAFEGYNLAVKWEQAVPAMKKFATSIGVDINNPIGQLRVKIREVETTVKDFLKGTWKDFINQEGAFSKEGVVKKFGKHLQDAMIEVGTTLSTEFKRAGLVLARAMLDVGDALGKNLREGWDKAWEEIKKNFDLSWLKDEFVKAVKAAFAAINPFSTDVKPTDKKLGSGAPFTPGSGGGLAGRIHEEDANRTWSQENISPLLQHPDGARVVGSLEGGIRDKWRNLRKGLRGEETDNVTGSRSGGGAGDLGPKSTRLPTATERRSATRARTYEGGGMVPRELDPFRRGPEGGEAGIQASSGGGMSTREGEANFSQFGTADAKNIRREGRGGGGRISLTPEQKTELATATKAEAERLGLPAEDLATIFSFETAGSLDPWKAGPITQHGQHRGLIQWGEPQAKQYGVTREMSITDQVKAAGRYLEDRGFKPGEHTGVNAYAAINAGRATNLTARDAHAGGTWGTVADKWNYQMGGHRAKARRLLADNEGAAPAAADHPAQVPSNNIPKGGNRAAALERLKQSGIKIPGSVAGGGENIAKSEQTLAQRMEKEAAQVQGWNAPPVVDKPATRSITANGKSEGMTDTEIDNEDRRRSEQRGYNSDKATSEFLSKVAAKKGSKKEPKYSDTFYGENPLSYREMMPEGEELDYQRSVGGPGRRYSNTSKDQKLMNEFNAWKKQNPYGVGRKETDKFGERAIHGGELGGLKQRSEMDYEMNELGRSLGGPNEDDASNYFHGVNKGGFDKLERKASLGRDPVKQLASTEPVQMGRHQVAVSVGLEEGLKAAIHKGKSDDKGLLEVAGMMDRTGSRFSRPGDPSFA